MSKEHKNKLVLSASNYGTKVKIVLESDSSLDDIIGAFKSLVIGLTWSERQWNQAIGENFNEEIPPLD